MHVLTVRAGFFFGFFKADDDEDDEWSAIKVDGQLASYQLKLFHWNELCT